MINRKEGNDSVVQAPLLINDATGSGAYLTLLDTLLKEGERSAPRGQATRELLDVTLRINDMREAHVLNTGRVVSSRIMATETIQLLAGLSSLEQLDLASKGRFSQFADEGRLKGAYGPRVHRQLTKILSLLKRQPDTRQAVVTIWRGDEHETPSRDVPCTQAIQFLVRDGKLHVRVTMRSSDIHLGLPYDLVMFSRLTMVMANALKLEPGSYTHTAGSQHLYERDEEISWDILSTGLLSQPRTQVPPPLIIDGSEINSLGLSRLVAGAIVLGESVNHAVDASPDVLWYREHVPQVSGVAMCIKCRYVVPTAQMSPWGSMCARCHA